MAAKIGSLLIDLSADVAHLQKDFNHARKTMDGALGKMGSALKSFAGLAGAYLGGRELINFAQQSLEAASTLARASDQIGVSVESLQELRFAATQVGVGAEDLDQILRDLGDRMGDAAYWLLRSLRAPIKPR